MPDKSHLDTQYFIDAEVYNCPFCNRRNVKYEITDVHVFDWTEAKKCTVVFVKCTSCRKESMHLGQGSEADLVGVSRRTGDTLFAVEEIDDHLFYSVPTSFHVVDDRIPRLLRELLTEAEGCLKSNFLTGASACVRKAVYELAVNQGAEGENYDERIKSLKDKLPQVDPAYFDTLLTIQQVTSSKVHEGSYDGWESKHLRLILATLKEVLQEVFVVPKEREERRNQILGLKAEVIDGKAAPGNQPATPATEAGSKS